MRGGTREEPDTVGKWLAEAPGDRSEGRQAGRCGPREVGVDTT